MRSARERTIRHLNAEFTILNAEFTIVHAEFIILNAKTRNMFRSHAGIMQKTMSRNALQTKPECVWRRDAHRQGPGQSGRCQRGILGLSPGHPVLELKNTSNLLG